MVFITLGGLLGPLSSWGQLGAYPNLTLPQIREPESYKPPPSRCARWQGKSFVVRVGVDLECVAGCSVELVDESGSSARYALTGASCNRRMRSGAPAAPGSNLAAPEAAGGPQFAPPINHAPAAKGQAKNYYEKPIEGVPPGMRAGAKR